MGIQALIYIALTLILLSILAGIYRLFRGPSLFDQALALEALGINFMAVLLFYMVLHEGAALFMDVFLVFSLLSFLATVFIALFLERDVEE